MSKKFSDFKIKKFLTIFFTSLILLIPNSFISDIISDRLEYKNEAIEKLAKSWANSQIISMPSMMLLGKNIKLNTCDTKINIKTQIRKKGVFKIPVYTAEITQNGFFDNPFGNILNKQTQTKIQISDSRGFIDDMQFNINNSGLKHTQDVVFVSNLTTNLKTIPFEIKYKIKGLNTIGVVLSAKKNNITINGVWKDPSFEGDFLPIERKVTDEKFSAQWNIPQIAISNNNSKVEVSLLVQNDNYIFVKKALKYAFLLLTLIFCGYFVFEITSKENKKIHPMQYCLLGGAILMFYLLLVSMSEIISFGFAYLLSALLVIGLIYMYTYFVITKKSNLKFSVGISILIGLLYLFFYILLNAQDIALFSGSISLFIILAIIMYTTRNVNWYGEDIE